jgi:hypothetical protein
MPRKRNKARKIFRLIFDAASQDFHSIVACRIFGGNGGSVPDPFVAYVLHASRRIVEGNLLNGLHPAQHPPTLFKRGWMRINLLYLSQADAWMNDQIMFYAK